MSSDEEAEMDMLNEFEFSNSRPRRQTKNQQVKRKPLVTKTNLLIFRFTESSAMMTMVTLAPHSVIEGSSQFYLSFYIHLSEGRKDV